MGALLPAFKTAIVNGLVSGISTNTVALYAFASNPVTFSGNTPAVTIDDYNAQFLNDWLMLFGKRIQSFDVTPVIRNVTWTSNTVYAQYDNTRDLSNSNFYVISPPVEVGGPRNIFKCLDNANGAYSINQPTLVQPSSFATADGYTWRYVATMTAAEYDKFHTSDYAPVYTNSTIAAASFSYSGVEKVVLTNGGNGYSAYSISSNNYVLAVVNSTVIQVQNYESPIQGYYVNSGIYIYNISAATSQLMTVSGYSSNALGNFVTLSTAANTTNIQALITRYYISPRVVFTCDSNTAPAAYTTMNTTSNSIYNVVVVDPGAGITRANVSIVTNTALVSSNASAYAIVPPPGGHGHEPSSELFAKGIGISFTFANSEANTIQTNITYNQIGLVVNPHALLANAASGNAYIVNTFSSVLQGTLTPTTSFAVGNVVTGQTTGSKGIVAFCNGTSIYLTGDKGFTNNETIVSSNGTASATLSINTLGQVYTKDLRPLYIQNIANVTRSANTAESYKLVITI